MTITKTRDHFDHMMAEYKKDEAERAQLMALFGGGKVPAKRAHPGAAVASSSAGQRSTSLASTRVRPRTWGRRRKAHGACWAPATRPLWRARTT